MGFNSGFKGLMFIFWRNVVKKINVTIYSMPSVQYKLIPFINVTIFPSFWIWSFIRKLGQFLVCTTSWLVPSPRRLAWTWLWLNRTELRFALESSIWLVQEKQEGLKATVTCQLLHYGHRITLLGGKIEYNTTEEIAEYVIKRMERTQSHTHLKQNIGQNR